jgi:hypothetical protein
MTMLDTKVYFHFQLIFTLNRGASEQICFRNVNTRLRMFILTSVLLYKRARKGKTRFYDEEGDAKDITLEFKLRGN